MSLVLTAVFEVRKQVPVVIEVFACFFLCRSCEFISNKMARGQQKLQSQAKAQEKLAKQKKQQGHSATAQKKAAQKALVHVCAVCKVIIEVIIAMGCNYGECVCFRFF